MLTIYKKEIHNYFSTFIGYIFISAVLLVGGIYCYVYNFMYAYGSFESSINQLPFFFVFLIPVISSGIFTDEKRQKTEQLLYTLPLKSWQIVWGKYLALVTILAIPLITLGIYPVIMSFYGEVNFIVAYSNIFAIFLLGATLSAICMFVSSLTDNIIVSAVICFAIMFVLFQMATLADKLQPSAKNSYMGFIILAVFFALFIWFMTKNIFIAMIPSFAIIILLNVLYKVSMGLVAGKINVMMSSMAVFSKLRYFTTGIFDINAVIYYFSIIGLFVLFTVYTFEKRRWS